MNTSRMKWAAAITCGLALLALGCAINPVSGRPQAVLGSESGEVQAGRKAALAIEQTVGLVEDLALNQYVNEIGQRLVAHSARSQLEHRFRVVEMPQPNAFALPSGDIYVSRGLLALINSEDELANVIAHEVAHVAARHAASDKVRRAAFIPVQVVGAIGGMAGSILSPTLGKVVSGVATLPGGLALAKYSRGQEEEADRIGQAYAAAAGWDPAGMSAIMTTFGREEALHGGTGRLASYFSTHPNNEKRSVSALALASKLDRAPARPIVPDRRALLARLEGLVVGDRGADGVFVGTRFLHPELHFAVTLPEGWEVRNTSQAVLSRSPNKQHFVVVTLAGKGDDPLATAQEFANKRGLREAPTALRIGGLPAAHGVHMPGRASSNPALHLTWIAHGDAIYQITGVSPPRFFAGHAGIFNTASRSFRKLSQAERNEVREQRLRFTEARRGETLARLLARAASEWSAEEAAVANGLEADAVLDRGQFVKFPHLEPYRTP